MKNTDILKKTMPFVWMRFGLYFLLGIGIIIYFVLIFLLLGSFITGSGAGAIFGIIAIVVGFAIYSFAARYINWLVKAAHIAVIAELSEKGTVPEGMSIVKYGQEQVKKRFVAATVFWALDGLVSGAVRQIQSVISKIGGLLERLPGIGGAMQAITTIVNLFVGIVLGYVDEAVLARIFMRKDENAWKGAADGVVLYFENWKAILKNAVGLVIFVVVFYAVGGVIMYGLCYGLIALLVNTESIWLFIITALTAILILMSIKASFVDSWITISVVNKYTQVTYNQQPKFDLYNKAKGWSKKFNKLCSNAEAEGAVVGGVMETPGQPGMYPNGMPQAAPSVNYPTMPGQEMAQTSMQQPMMQQPAMGQPMGMQPQPQPMMGQPVQPQPMPMNQVPAPQPMPADPMGMPNPAPMQQPQAMPQAQPMVQSGFGAQQPQDPNNPNNMQ